MSALERVIAEQQAEIDRLKRWRDSNDLQWQKHHQRREKFMEAVFSYYHGPTPEARIALLHAIQAEGYCITCEQSPCECDGQYD